MEVEVTAVPGGGGMEVEVTAVPGGGGMEVEVTAAPGGGGMEVWSRELSLCRCGEPGRTPSSLDPGQCCQPRQTHQRVPVHQPWQGLGPRGVCVMCERSAIVFFNPCILPMQWALFGVQSHLKGGH